MEQIISFFDKSITLSTIPRIGGIDLLEIFLIGLMIAGILEWVKKTSVMSLMRGLGIILVFILLAWVLQMNTILWLVKNGTMIAIMALVVVFQPELRKALESLGKKNVLSSILNINSNRLLDDSFTDETVEEIVRACFEMGKVKTGALIVVARDNDLNEYTRTGIAVDGLVTSQLLINIFEHNTPLHDGAVVIQGNRVASATCYLPLSNNLTLSKELGTRHRAGVGVSEATDTITVIVSEETGRVSVAMEGELYRNVNADFVREKLSLAVVKPVEEKKLLRWIGRSKDEESSN